MKYWCVVEHVNVPALEMEGDVLVYISALKGEKGRKDAERIAERRGGIVVRREYDVGALAIKTFKEMRMVRGSDMKDVAARV